MNDGSQDWVLEQVASYNPMQVGDTENRQEARMAGWGAVDRLEADRLPNEPELLTALLTILASAGALHEKERGFI